MDLDKLDSFESLFRSAVKETFSYEKISLQKILLIDDNSLIKSQELLQRIQKFLQNILDLQPVEWKILSGEDFHSVDELIQKCKEEEPSLLITYRHLKNPNKDLTYSLGTYVDMLTQATPYPILLLPYFPDKQSYEQVLENTNSVTVIADHITGENRLINYGLTLTEKKGHLFITHIENDGIFNTYMNIIGKIPEIPTTIARKKIKTQLLKEPSDYIHSIINILKKLDLQIEIHPIIRMGHTLKEYKAHIENHQVDLLVMNAKDTEQIAMHGMAYCLAIELKSLPLLLL